MIFRYLMLLLQAITMVRSRVRAVRASSSEQFRTARRLSVDTVTRASSAWPTARNVLHVGLIDVARRA